MSANLQDALDKTGRQVGSSATDVMRAIDRVGNKDQYFSTADGLTKRFERAMKNGKFFSLQSTKDRFAEIISRRNKRFIKFISSEIATTSVSEDVRSETPIPLSSLVDLDKAESTLATREEKKLDQICPKTLVVEGVCLSSTCYTPASNPGVIVTVAVDRRAKNPQDAILGGHIQKTSESPSASSCFFPLYRISTRDGLIDKALKVLTVGSGFELNTGAIVGITRPMIVGEVTQDPNGLGLKSSVISDLAKTGPVTHTNRCFPIHPYRPSSVRNSEIILPWETVSKALKYSGHSTNGNAVWEVDKTESFRGVNFRVLESQMGLKSRAQQFSDIAGNSQHPFTFDDLGAVGIGNLVGGHTDDGDLRTQGKSERQTYFPSE